MVINHRFYCLDKYKVCPFAHTHLEVLSRKVSCNVNKDCFVHTVSEYYCLYFLYVHSPQFINAHALSSLRAILKSIRRSIQLHIIDFNMLMSLMQHLTCQVELLRTKGVTVLMASV